MGWKIKNLDKKGGLGQFADLKEGGLGKKEGVVFWRGVDTPMHTMTAELNQKRVKAILTEAVARRCFSK